MMLEWQDILLALIAYSLQQILQIAIAISKFSMVAPPLSF
jgi:hypothetical protein